MVTDAPEYMHGGNAPTLVWLLKARDAETVEQSIGHAPKVCVNIPAEEWMLARISVLTVTVSRTFAPL